MKTLVPQIFEEVERTPTKQAKINCLRAYDHPVLRGMLQINFNPNLVKVDIEGSELEVLHGAKKLIHKYRPNLCISVYHRPGDPLDILDLLASWNLGYQFYLRCHEYNAYGLVLYCVSQNVSGDE